jgi:hypothetical protein
MIYHIHHPAGPVVIRTNNPYIVLHHQNLGWCTTTSFDDVLHDHPEWQSKISISNPTSKAVGNMVSRAASAVLGAMSTTMAILPAYTPSSTATIAPLLASNSAQEDVGEVSQEPVANSAPVQWMTALTRSHYKLLNLDIPQAGWIVPTEAPIPFEYRLEPGVWDLLPEARPDGDRALSVEKVERKKE